MSIPLNKVIAGLLEKVCVMKEERARGKKGGKQSIRVRGRQRSEKDKQRWRIRLKHCEEPGAEVKIADTTSFARPASAAVALDTSHRSVHQAGGRKRSSILPNRGRQESGGEDDQGNLGLKSGFPWHLLKMWWRTFVAELSIERRNEFHAPREALLGNDKGGQQSVTEQQTAIGAQIQGLGVKAKTGPADGPGLQPRSRTAKATWGQMCGTSSEKEYARAEEWMWRGEQEGHAPSVNTGG